MALIFIIFVMAVGDIGGFKLYPLIVGGRLAKIEEAPFMALYRRDTPDFSNTCGGSILSKKFVLSAAHCYEEAEDITYSVLVGTDQYNTGQHFDIEKTIIHPNYNSITTDYDVLVLKLYGKLKYGAKIQPIKMADSKLIIKEGAILDTFGFGITENGLVSKHLRRVRVPYVRKEKCKAVYNDMLTDRMICAGKKGKDSCEGDSGGPLVYDNVLIGVVSFGMECGDSYFPGVYASVSKLRNFIDYAIKTN